jgi:hypothetical protein
MTLFESLNALESASASGSFNGYGRRPLPDSLDSVPQSVVQLYLAAPLEEREFLSCLSASSCQVLAAYAEREASLAVRNQSPAALRLSLLALGLSALTSHDGRESVSVLSLPWRSAELLGLNPEGTFEDVAALLPDSPRSFIRAFAGRPAPDRTLDTFGYREGKDAGGFRYERTW